MKMPKELRTVGAQVFADGIDGWEVQDREGIFIGRGHTRKTAIENALEAFKLSADERAQNSGG